MRILSPLLIGLVFFQFTSCNKDDDPIPELNANAGIPQNAKIDEIVTLDGTGSSGPNDFTFSWTYQGSIPESEINFQKKNSASPTFIPPLNGNYTFTLTISSGDKISTDKTVVIISGAIEIGGVLSEDFELKNIESDNSLPDYIVTSDLVIPDGIVLGITDDDVIVSFEAGTGIHINEGGTFTNGGSQENLKFNSELRADQGWKGILVENGKIDLGQTLIINAGSSPFEGLSEAAAITLKGSEVELISLYDNEFVNSLSFDLLVLDKSPQKPGSVGGNKHSFNVPIKAPITFWGNVDANNPVKMPDEYDFIHLIPSGANEKDELSDPEADFNFTGGNKFFIDGDFWVGSEMWINGGSTLFIKEGASLLFENDLYISSSAEKNQITGLNEALWNGIVFSPSGSNTMSINDCIISNAGNGLIEIGSVTTAEPAAVYSKAGSGLGFSNSEIINSNGYGIYYEYLGLVNGRLKNNRFNNISKAAIGLSTSSLNRIIAEDHGNIFELSDDVPAVMVLEGDLNPIGTIIDLGNTPSAYYLFDFDWSTSGNMILSPGVHIKFTSGHAFLRISSPADNIFRMKGEIDNPIIFEGEFDSSGAWGGMLLEGRFDMEYVIVKNGGEFLLPGATELANIVSSYQSSTGSQEWFRHNTISNSAGWGIVMEAGSYYFDFLNPAQGNTFSNNSSGDVTDKR